MCACYGSLLSVYSCWIMLLSNDGCDLCFLESKPYVTYPIACPEANNTVTSVVLCHKVFHLCFRHYPLVKGVVIFFFFPNRRGTDLKLVHALMPLYWCSCRFSFTKKAQSILVSASLPLCNLDYLWCNSKACLTLYSTYKTSCLSDQTDGFILYSE